MREYLVEKLPKVGGQRVDEMLDEGRFVDESGRTFRRDSPSPRRPSFSSTETCLQRLPFRPGSAFSIPMNAFLW